MTYLQQRYFRHCIKQTSTYVRYINRRMHLDSNEQYVEWTRRQRRAALRIAKVTRGLSADEMREVQELARQCTERMWEGGAPCP